MTKKTRPTVNMNWQEKRSLQADDFIKESNSDYVYLLNPDTYSIDTALNTGKKVIARIFDPFGDWSDGNSFDNQFHYLRTAEETYQWFMRSEFVQYRKKDVYFIVGMNEPSANDAADIAAGLKWALDFGRLMVSSDYKVNLGGWNISKSIRMGWDNVDNSATAPDVNNGVWDDLLKFAQHNREDVILDIHVYTVGRAWGQLVSGFPNDIISMNNPPNGLEWGERLNNGHHPYWHVGRSNPLFVRMKEIGCPDVRFGIGECIWDNMADISNIVENMRNSYGIPEYMNDMRGILSLRNYYAYLRSINASDYTDEKFSIDAFQDMIWLDKVYPANFEYFAVFAWNTNNYWLAYDVSHPTMTHFIDLMKNYTGRNFEDTGSGGSLPDDTPTIPPPEDPLWSVGTLQFDGLNFRGQPSIDGDIIFTLNGDEHGMINEAHETGSDGYMWIPIYIESVNHFGWVAKYKISEPTVDYFTFIEDEVQVPPTEPVKRYIIDLLGMSTIMSESEYQMLLTFHRQIVIGLENAQSFDIESDDYR